MIPGVKYDNGPIFGQKSLSDIPANCFPVRNLLRSSSSNQQWVVALRDTEQRRFAAILTTLSSPTPFEGEVKQAEIKKRERWSGKEKTVDHLLDGFFIMHHCAIEDPSNVVILNVNGLDLQDVKEEDFLLFDNVIRVDASENKLPFHGFKTFPQLTSLDLSCNQLKNLKLNINDYETLEELNVSYNNLTMHDIELLGMLPSLRILRASGNDLVGLSRRLAKPYVHSDIHGKEFVKERFPRLEELYLDHNKLIEDELFIHLSSLKSLKRLHLQHNQIRTIPFLKVLQGRQIVQEFSKTALKRKQNSAPNASMNYFQHGLGNTNDVLIKSTIFEEDEENASSTPHAHSLTDDEEVSLPAFPELQFLDLSHNLIEEEDDIMAMASWPSLTEIILADNPLIQHHVGLPPLVESFLVDRLGMKIYRTNPSLKPEKQFYAKPIKKNRQVISRMTKVPKIPVEQLLTGAVKQYLDYVKEDSNELTHEGLFTSTTDRNSSSNDDKYITTDTTLNETLHDEQKNASTIDPNSTRQTENIFMTEFENEETYPAKTIPISRQNPSETQIPQQTLLLPDDKFKGYELFLDIDNENDIVVPQNVIHCVRDLKHILRNPLVIRHDNVQVHRRQRKFIPKRMERTLPPLQVSARPKVEEINSLLDAMRDRKTIIDRPLTEVLNNSKDPKAHRRAKSLVSQVQRHYENVRTASLRNVRTPGTILETAIDRLQQFDSNIALNKPKSPVSRVSTA